MSLARKKGILTATGSPGPSQSSPADHGQDYARLAFGQAIKKALEDLRKARGWAETAHLFDGRDGGDVAESTLSRWVSEPSRFPAVFLPILVEESTGFRSYVFQHLTARMVTTAEVMERMPAEHRESYAKAIQSRLFDELAPQRRGK